MKSKIIIIVSIVLFIAAVVSGGIYYRSQNFELVAAKKGNIVEAIYGLGKVKSESRFEVKVGIMTSVSKLYVREGQSVKKNDPLIKFKDTGIFRSPIHGKVTLVNNYENETVLPQQAVVRVEDLQNRIIEVSLEQQGALRIKSGQIAKVIFESLRGEKYEGVVKSIFPRNDEFLAHIDVPNMKKNILPGMTADVAIVVGEIDDALLIPLSSIDNGKISIKKNQRKTKINVKIGKIDGSWAEVVEGDISVGDEIFVKKRKD